MSCSAVGGKGEEVSYTIPVVSLFNFLPDCRFKYLLALSFFMYSLDLRGLFLGLFLGLFVGLFLGLFFGLFLALYFSMTSLDLLSLYILILPDFNLLEFQIFLFLDLSSFGSNSSSSNIIFLGPSPAMSEENSGPIPNPKIDEACKVSF